MAYPHIHTHSHSNTCMCTHKHTRTHPIQDPEQASLPWSAATPGVATGGQQRLQNRAGGPTEEAVGGAEPGAGGGNAGGRGLAPREGGESAIPMSPGLLCCLFGSGMFSLTRGLTWCLPFLSPKYLAPYSRVAIWVIGATCSASLGRIPGAGQVGPAGFVWWL